MATDIFDKYKTNNVPKTPAKVSPSEDIFSKYRTAGGSTIETDTIKTPTVEESVSAIFPEEKKKSVWQKFGDAYMGLSDKLGDVADEIPLAGGQAAASIPSGLAGGLVSLSSIADKFVRSKAENSLAYKTLYKFFPEQTEKALDTVLSVNKSERDAISKFKEKYLDPVKNSVAEEVRLYNEGYNIYDQKVREADTKNIVEKGVGGLMGTLTYMAPAILSAPTAGATGASLLGGFLEAGVDSDQVYDDNIQQGLSPQEARNKADIQFVTSGIVNTLSDKLGIFGDTKSVFKRILNTELTEVPAETITQLSSNLLTGKEWKEGLAETALITAFVSPILGAFGHASVAPTEEIEKRLEQNKEYQMLPDDQKEAVKSQILSFAQTAQEANVDVKEIASQFTQDEDISDVEPYLKKEAPQDEAMFQRKSKKTTEEILIEQAKKYKTPQEFIDRAIHGSATQYGDYTPEFRYGGSPGGKRLNELGIDPEETVTIYRGIDDMTGKIPKKINDGDFVTTDYDSAWSYAGDNVVEMEVKAKDLISEDPESFLEDPFYIGSEYIYSTKHDAKPLTDEEATRIWEKAHGKKDTKEVGLTTKILEDLKGRETVSKQYILDATNRGDIKQQERDIIRQALESEGDKVNVPDFTKKVQVELLPLTTETISNKPIPTSGRAYSNRSTRYENITLPSELRGKVANYSENIYQSPIRTSAGDVHFGRTGAQPEAPNYFGHTRIEDMADNKTRRVIEVQSDLYQKGRLENEADDNFSVALRKLGLEDEHDTLLGDIGIKNLNTEQRNRLGEIRKQVEDLIGNRKAEVAKLRQYNDPTAHFRMVREEVKKAAEDGKTNLLFPTGETAMKIEGLGENTSWTRASTYARNNRIKLDNSDIKVGLEISDGNSDWIITDVLGDGKFKAVQKDRLDDLMEDSGIASDTIEPIDAINYAERHISDFDSNIETFDISGKVDTNNPIYKFYEKDLGRYLKSKYDAKPITDDNGVTWYEVDVKSEYSGPVEAFKESDGSETVSAQTAVDVIKSMSKRMGLVFPTYVYKKIYTGEVIDGSPAQAYGMFLDNVISLAETVKITTGEHEMVHLVFRNLENIPMFKGITRSDLLNELRKIPGNEKLSKRDLEEKLAEGFEQYATEQLQNKPTTFTGKLKKFFEDLYEALKEILGISRKQYNAIQRFYDKMYFGKSNEVVSLYNTNKTSEFMEARFQEFGEEPELSDAVPMFQIQEEYQRHVADVQLEQIKGRLTNLDQDVKETEKQIVSLEKRITKAELKGQPTAKLQAELDTLETKWERLDEQRGSLLTLENKADADLASRDVTVKGKTLEDIAKASEKIGQKKGVLSEKERQALRDKRRAERKGMSDRQFELKQLREGITRRLYTKSTLDMLRKNIPRKEWADYMTRLSQIGISETKYLDLAKDIMDRKAQIDIENYERIDRSRMRSNIGYLKKVYDIEPSLVLSIKEDLDIRDTYKTGEKAGQKKESLKSIKDYSIEELQFFMDELQKRINFRKENPVKYLDLAKLEEEKTFAKKLGDAIVKVDETIIATMERTLQKISKPVYESMMTVFFQMEKSTARYSKLMEPIYEIYNKATEADQEQIKLYAQSSEDAKLRSVLEQYATPEEVDNALKDVRVVLDEIHTNLKEVGVDVPYRSTFFPRKLKPLTVAQADLALKVFENKIGKKATAEEKSAIINSLLRGFDVSRLPFVSLSGKRFEAHRMIETLTEELSPFYEDFGKALNSYVQSAINVIETRKYFGKFQIDSLDYDASLSQSIGAKVYELFDQGIVKQEDLDKLKDIMQTVFQYRVSKNVQAIQQFTNSIVYPLTLAQIGSTINQLKDLSSQMLLNDIFALQMNTLGDIKVKPEDVYLTDSFAELENGTESQTKFAKFAELAMTPFSKADNSFLRIFINATKRRLIKQAKANNVRLQKGLIDIFGEEKGMEVMNDLKGMDTSNSEISDDIARVIWGEVAKVRPITKLQKTRTAVRHPYLYTLKNFMIKQIQFVRSQSFDMIVEGYQNKDKKLIAEGVGRLAVMMAFIGFFGAGVDELKDLILGKSEDKTFWDRVTDNLLQVVGFNSYLLSMGEKNGYAQQLLYSYIPSSASVFAQAIDMVVEDVVDTIDGDPIYEAKSIRKLPLAGELIYQRFGGGSNY